MIQSQIIAGEDIPVTTSNNGSTRALCVGLFEQSHSLVNGSSRSTAWEDVVV